jgi:carboxypeptidase Taq
MSPTWWRRLRLTFVRPRTRLRCTLVGVSFLNTPGYSSLVEHFRRIHGLQHIDAIVSWDEATNTRGGFSKENQRRLAHELLRILEFDFTRGCLDSTTHPFCGGSFCDTRIALRYEESDFLPAFSGAIHECGHAKYEQHLPRDWRWQPVSAARGACIHESQSLLIEMQIGRSDEFLSFVAPILSAVFRDMGPSVDGEFEPRTLRDRLTRVTPSHIRVDADELT